MAGLPEVPWSVIASVLGSGGLGGIWAWLAAKRKGKTDDQESVRALIKLAQDTAADQVKSLREEVTALREDAKEDRQRIDGLERELAEEKRARKVEREERHRLANQVMEAERRAGEAERARDEAVGALRQAQQLADSLSRLLRDHGIAVPPPPERQTEPVLMGEPVA